MASAVPALLVCLLLFASLHLGCSYYTSYTHGGKHYVVRSNHPPGQPSPPCSSIDSGRSSSDGLPVVHRLSPCSPLGAARNPQVKMPSAADVLRRDALRLRSLFGEDSSTSKGPTPAPPSGVRVTITDRGDPVRALPGALEYHVTAGFGTPVQTFAVGFDTATVGATELRCTPCAPDPEPCDTSSFDPSRSSSLAPVPCGSPDCPFHGCSGPSCTLSLRFNATFNATFVTDTLTLAPSTTVEKLRFVCLEGGVGTGDGSSGVLDLSRNSHSLASRAPSSPDTVAFSYCLPLSATKNGFLAIGAARPELSGRNVSYTPLLSNPINGNLYFLQLAGLSLNGHDIPAPPLSLFGDTTLDLHTTFTYLRPPVYAALRDEFRRAMSISGYRAAPPQGELDTCYDFKPAPFIFLPVITLRFEGGASVDLSFEQTMFYPDHGDVFSVGCLAFAPAANRREVAVIGNLAQASMEVVYDVHGGTVGFVPSRC
ncbi:hypothetical protein ACP4OV_001349 [Aristida adscensionis]